MDTSFTPVLYEYREMIEEEIGKNTIGKVFFFNTENQLDCVEGRIVSLTEHGASGWFIQITPNSLIRIDRIITVFGRPGPAYDEYDAYANACLDCKGGYPID
ncbi:MAG: hypothetical protein ACK4RF_12730 [Cyclobacteriaceae bacterium]